MPAPGITAPSVFQTSVAWWQATTEIVAPGLTIGVSVIPFPGWSVPTLAAESATVSEITDGKFILGIGLGSYPSEQFVKEWGLPRVPPVALTRDYLCTLRGLLAGQKVDYTGQAVSLHGAQLGWKAPPVPVYLAAMGPQMLKLSGQLSDGVTPNWSSPEQIAWIREQVSEAARRAGRAPADVPIAQYIRVCIDDDEDAARHAFAAQVLSYAMARPGVPRDRGYRAHFGRMGFEEVLTEIEARHAAGTPVSELVDAVPADLLLRVGYFGRASGAAAAMKRLSEGLDEPIVRLVTVGSGDLETCMTSVRACQPSGWASS
jgi:alkanesulfonate monooxygenase SsuD/methylene tetrahydromethanopterin reductase-like flavin-dependent oxidoreductase (luciferase family)